MGLARITKNTLKTDLINQLKNKDALNAYTEDLVNQYIFMWGTVQKLQQDIDDRGVITKYQNGKDQWGHKKNDSVQEMTKVNNQMLKILDQLKLKVPDEPAKKEPIPISYDLI